MRWFISILLLFLALPCFIIMLDDLSYGITSGLKWIIYGAILTLLAFWIMLGQDKRVIGYASLIIIPVIILYAVSYSQSKSWVTVDAVVTNVKVETDSNGINEREVYVSYFHDGIHYYDVYYGRNSWNDVGDTLKVTISSNNPSSAEGVTFPAIIIAALYLIVSGKAIIYKIEEIKKYGY